MPRIYLPKRERPPREGDLFIVKKVFASTGDLHQPVWDVWVELITPEEVVTQERKKKPWGFP
jgi:hypothetical protein